LNDAQTRFNNALSRLVNAQYNVKISALELLRLSGQLAQ
jgi:outer membrane protein